MKSSGGTCLRQLPLSPPLDYSQTPRISPTYRSEGPIMDAATIEIGQIDRPLQAASARIGMIIPSVNSMTEPQFNRFAPAALGVHVARARVAGPWKRPLANMTEEIATSARLLADVAPDLIVFHCTDTSMTQGPHGEGRIPGIVR